MDENSIEANGSSNELALPIWQVNKDRLTWMHQKIADTPRILSRSAGRTSCCIFKVPQSFVDINGPCYQPHIASVGPFHHGDPRLKMIEEHKWRYLGCLLKRVEVKGLKLEDFLKAVQPLEDKARDSYSTAINLSTDEFIELLVLDGCFVIELFRKFGLVVPFDADDPLVSMSWVQSFLLRDLIRLENQIPFFILQLLFDLTLIPGDESGPTLPHLTLTFFNAALQKPDKFVDRFRNRAGNWKHVLDLVRTSFIPDGDDKPREISVPNTPVIHAISKLRRAGIRFNAVEDKSMSFLAVKFKRSTIVMPMITIDDFMSAFLLNCVAYEQCHAACTNHMTTYATLLDCLINTAKDVEHLCERNILENYFGTEADVAKFINNLGKDVPMDMDACYLTDLFNEVDHYYWNHWHRHWASFKYTYFNTPWSFISALAAFVLLLLTVTQTLYTVLAYVRQK